MLYFAPNVFRQANLDAFAHIISAIRQRLEQQKQPKLDILELYGGVGTIGLHLLDLPSTRSLICSDENPYNRPCFEKSLSVMEHAFAQRAKYMPYSASDMVTQHNSLQNCHVLIVDPPRKGLDDVVLEALTRVNENSKKLQLLVYVSCGFDAFQRDYQKLKTKWKLEHAEGHVLFPGSNAIETLAYFTLL